MFGNFYFHVNVPYFGVIQKSRSCLDSYIPTKYIFFFFMSPPRPPLFHAFCFSTQKRIGRMKQAGGNALFNENVLFFYSDKNLSIEWSHNVWPKMGSKLFNTFARLKYSKIKPILYKTQLNYGHYPHYFRHLLPTIDYSKRQLQLLVLLSL